MTPTKVTIVIPTYNRSRLLEEALSSALLQDYSDFQVVVLDNASTDNTEATVRSFNDDRITYIRNETNIGLFRNWNRAIEVNTSPYLNILQDDDLVLPGFIRESVFALDSYPQAAFSVVRATAVDLSGTPVVMNVKDMSDPIPQGYIDGSQFLHRIVNGDKWITHFSTVMIRSSALKAVGPFDHPHSKDTLDINLFYRLAAQFGIVLIPQELAQVRQHSGRESEASYSSSKSTGPLVVLAERIDALGYLLQSDRAADATYRRWLAERLFFLNLCLSTETHRLIPELNYDWAQRLQHAIDDIEGLMHPGEKFILVDANQWSLEATLKGRIVPFLEREGSYWGPPPDDETAIREVERLRHDGVTFLIFGWPAFWWFDYYAGFRDYLYSRFSCVLKNSRIIAFDLSR